MDQTSERERALRARLVELTSAVRGYFETTLAGAGGGSFAAFDALRRNQHMAQSFVADLEELLSFVERELIPALGGARPNAPASAPPPRGPAAARPAAESINEDETMLLNRLPAKVQKEAVRLMGQKPAPVREAPRPNEDDGDISLLTDIEPDPETDKVPRMDRPLPAKADKAPSRGAGAARGTPPSPAGKSIAPGHPPQAGPGSAPGKPRGPSPGPAAAPKPSPVGAVAARMAALSQRPATSERPPIRSALPQRPDSTEKTDPPRPPSAPSPQRAVAPGAERAQRQTSGRPHPAKLSGRVRAAPAPHFDESDVTSPGFTMDRESPSKKL